MYTLLRVARRFYEIRQVKRNHPVSSGVSLSELFLIAFCPIFRNQALKTFPKFQRHR